MAALNPVKVVDEDQLVNERAKEILGKKPSKVRLEDWYAARARAIAQLRSEGLISNLRPALS